MEINAVTSLYVTDRNKKISKVFNWHFLGNKFLHTTTPIAPMQT